MVCGAIVSILNYWKLDDKKKIYIKLACMITLAISMPFLAYVTEFPEGKYIGIIFFGYSCNYLWKTNK